MKRLRALGLSIVIATFAIGCNRRAKSAVEWSSKKTPFKRGTALMHAPESCGGGRLFLDLAAADKNVATHAAVDVLGGRVFSEVGASVTERRVFAALRDALRDEGLDVMRDTRELIVCYPGGSGSLTAVFAGEYSGKDVLRAIRVAAERLGDTPPRIEERSGVEYVRLGKLVIARVAANVVALGEDVSTLASLGREIDRSARYEYTAGLVAAARIGNELEGIGLRFGDAGEDVTVEVSLRVKDSVADLERRKASVATRIEDTPLKGLAPLAASAQITSAAGRATFSMRGRAADVANAIQTAADLPPAEVKRIVGYVFGGADGSGGVEQKI